MTQSGHVCPVSVVVPTMRGWPVMSIAVTSVLPQVRRVGGQLIIADGSGRELPPMLRDADDVVWLKMPGATVFEIRQAAYRRAEADIIAVTEDHCRPDDDWLETILGAHAEDPAAALIFGSVENGSRRHLIDWALYCAGYAGQAPPLDRATRVSPGHANSTWKRWAFDRLTSSADNALEFRLNAALRRAGERVVADSRLRVRHFQCEPVRPTAILFFHNGRAIAGIRRANMTSLDWLRVVAPTMIAGVRTTRSLRTAWHKPIRWHAIRSAPLIGLLHLSHALGEGIGYLSGPGDSGRHLH